MNDTAIQRLLDEGRLRADRQGSVLYAELGPPASADQIQDCEKAIAAELPANLRQFLECWNGIAVEFYEDEPHAKSHNWTHRLNVASTEMIARVTEGIRDFFAMGAETEPYSTEVQRRIDGLLVLSCDDDIIIYQPLDQRDANGNCPVMRFNLEYYPDWFDDPGVPIAESVDDFVTRSLRHMADTGESFVYWL